MNESTANLVLAVAGLLYAWIPVFLYRRTRRALASDSLDWDSEGPFWPGYGNRLRLPDVRKVKVIQANLQMARWTPLAAALAVVLWFVLWSWTGVGWASAPLAAFAFVMVMSPSIAIALAVWRHGGIPSRDKPPQTPDAGPARFRLR